MLLNNNIIGSGFIGSHFRKINNFLKNEEVILYSKGISNSRVKSQTQLKKELKLIKQFYKRYHYKRIIYISTACITDKNRNKSLYVKNKFKIENYIKKNFNSFLILRLPEVIGKSKNKNTLINFFYYKIKNRQKLILYKNIKRNIIDIEDVVKISKEIIKVNRKKNIIITLCNKYSTSPAFLVSIFEKKLRIKSKYSLKNYNKKRWLLNYKLISKYVRKANVNFEKNYLLKKIKKYY